MYFCLSLRKSHTIDVNMLHWFQYAWIWLLWLLSQTWITLHIWTPKCERLASTEKLFVSPMYNSLIIDQSLALNRRRDDDPDLKADEITTLAEEQEHEVSNPTTINDE